MLVSEFSLSFDWNVRGIQLLSVGVWLFSELIAMLLDDVFNYGGCATVYSRILLDMNKQVYSCRLHAMDCTGYSHHKN